MIEQRTEGALSTADIAGRDDRNREPETRHGVAVSDQNGAAPLFVPDEAQDFRSRWEKIQTGFVDDPRKSVEAADGLVAAAIKRLAEIFADERSKMEQEWGRGDNVSTEDLRVALRRYRSFFDRLLSL
jgi:hypothetical protein